MTVANTSACFIMQRNISAYGDYVYLHALQHVVVEGK